MKDKKAKETEEDYEHRRRKSFTQEGSKHVMDDMYNKPPEISVSNHRRKKFDELKSIQDRKKETEVNSYLHRSGVWFVKQSCKEINRIILYKMKTLNSFT